jgi:hypothetical protein
MKSLIKQKKRNRKVKVYYNDGKEEIISKDLWYWMRENLNCKDIIYHYEWM